MSRIRTRIAFGLCLSTGVTAGWFFAGSRPAPLQASSSRAGESISVTGPVEVQHHPVDKSQISRDGVYWLDYRAAKLFAAIPDAGLEAVSQSGLARTLNKLDPRKDQGKEGGPLKKVIEGIAERDLVEDFGLQAGVEPHFLMNTASLGAYGAGEAALYVFETTTKQVAVYRARAIKKGMDAKTVLDLVQIRAYAPPLPAGAGAGAGGRPEWSMSVAGPVVIQATPDKLQVPLDGIYWIDSRPAPDADGFKLYASIPSPYQIGTRTEVIGGVAERDLIVDFGIKPGTTPRFLMNTASLGAMVRGASAVLVFELTTKQVGVYSASPRAVAGNKTPSLELKQLAPFGQPPAPAGN
jgi:hypothetical protein